jgi:hypothetical protein
MSQEERRESLFQSWLSPKDPSGAALKFQSPEAEKSYAAAVTRIKDAVQMKKKPDRVPVCLMPSFYPAYYAGMTPRDVMYDYDKCVAAWRKFTLDFKPDLQMGATGPGPGKFYEILDYKLYAWSGHGVRPESPYQCLEGEYMKADEYDALIEDPSGFFVHTYLPRVFGALQPWSMLPGFTGILEMYGVALNFIPFGLPPVQNSFKALFEAGAEALKWAIPTGGFDLEMAATGIPPLLGGFTKAPFDVIGDTLRGTKGLMMDLYRQPEKVLKAVEALTPIMIKLGVGLAQMTGKPLIFIPLHKGADSFLSDAQFRKFYWPTLKEVMLGLADGGAVPLPWAEGGYDSRLEVIADLPRGTACWVFDQADMAKAKATVGKNNCIAGNVPSSALSLASPEEVKGLVKTLIDTAAADGGYILCNGAFFDEAKPENLTAMLKFGKEYGVYK